MDDAKIDYVVMLYVYGEVHVWDRYNKTIKRELLLAVPVFVTSNKQIADNYVYYGNKTNNIVYEVISVPMDKDMIQQCIEIMGNINEVRAFG